MIYYCEQCEEQQELEDGCCSVCGTKIIRKKYRSNLDSWKSMEDDEEDYELEGDDLET